MNYEPEPGSFEEYIWTYEVDCLGSEGLSTPEERRQLYADWKKLGRSDNRAAGAAKAVKTRAKNEVLGISQKNLTGSTKQKRWASEIRGKLIGQFSPGNQKFLMNNKIHSSFWINYRDVPVVRIDARLDKVYAALIEAINARDAVRGTPAQRDAWANVDKKKAAWNELLSGEDEVKNW